MIAAASKYADFWFCSLRQDRHSLSYQHNRLWKGDRKLLFTKAVNSSHPFAFETQSYTSVQPLGPSAALVLYNIYSGEGPAGFAMRVEFDAVGADETVDRKSASEIDN